MADFCKECSLNMFGFDAKDMAGLLTEDQVKAGLAAQVVCEGCGLIWVDNEGRRIEVESE